MKAMNNLRNQLLAMLSAVSMVPCMATFGQESINDDKTLSPYFFVKSDDTSLEQLPLKSTGAVVNIAGVIADVKISQVYQNTGRKPIEAIYIFPASIRAAVYGMRMTIGERVINAVIREKEQARKDYEQALNDGKTASLLEQQRPNVFQMNVGNIMPGDLVKVELSYTELLVPTDGVYSFVYPTVVGPRYSNKKDPETAQNDKWVANPYTHDGEQPSYTFNIHVNLSAGMPISEMECPSHAVNIQYSSESAAVVDLKNPGGKEGSRDFVLDYRLRGKNIQSGLLLYQGKEENFFLALIQPPASVSNQTVPLRDYVFIMDVSGSMYGFPLEVSKALLRELISGLNPTDKFNILLFAGASSVFSQESLPANADNLSRALAFIDKQQGGGATELLPALKEALSLKGTENYARTFVIVTDGYVDVEKEAFELIRNNLSKANFFAFGIGTAVNRYLIEGMAHAGKGEAFIAMNEAEAKRKAADFRKYIQYPVLTHISASYKGFQVSEVEPAFIPDVFADRPVLIMGKWKGTPSGKIVLKGISGQGEFTTELNVQSYAPEKSNAALTYLWARERIRNLDDFEKAGFGNEGRQEVTRLGLKYGLLTNYTSFVAVDSEIRNKEGNPVRVNQPLPLPEGVSNYAMGASAGAPGMFRSMKSVSYKMEETETLDIKDSVTGSISTGKPSPVTVESGPMFQGGETALKEFLRKNTRYPSQLKNSGITGKVTVSFIVDANGNMKDVKVLRGMNVQMDAEAMRVIRLTTGMWKPGMHNGKMASMPVQVVVIF